MSDWWDEGYESAKNKFCKIYNLSGRKKAKLVYNGLEV
jgi:hypothetical protein